MTQREWKGLSERGLTACALLLSRSEQKGPFRMRSLESGQSATRKRALLIGAASEWVMNSISATRPLTSNFQIPDYAPHELGCVGEQCQAQSKKAEVESTRCKVRTEEGAPQFELRNPYPLLRFGSTNLQKTCS